MTYSVIPMNSLFHRGWGCVLRHKVDNGLYGVVETGRERCRGALDEVFWRERLPSGKLCHNIGERIGEVA